MTKYTVEFTVCGTKVETSQFTDWDVAYNVGLTLAKAGFEDVEMKDYCTHVAYGCSIGPKDDEIVFP